MRCDFQFTTPPNDAGKREAHCVRCGQRSGWTASPLAEIRAECTAPAGLEAGLPGNELKKLLAEWGVSVTVDCGCEDKAHQMNVWGVAGCREHRTEIIGWLQDAAKSKGWASSLAAKVASGMLVDEAIRRASAAPTALGPRTLAPAT